MWIYYFELKQAVQDCTASTERGCYRTCFKHMVLQDNYSTWQDDSKDEGSAAGRAAHGAALTEQQSLTHGSLGVQKAYD